MADSNEWLRDKPLSDLYHRDARSLTDTDIERFEKAHDHDLMRASGSMHNLPAIEAMRRLRETIRVEERAIRILTRWLVGFTLALVFLTLALVGFAVYDWQTKRKGAELHSAPSVRATVPSPVSPSPR